MVRSGRKLRNWDRSRIKAAVVRRGSSLRQVALNAGLSESAARMALYWHRCPAGEKAIADFLGVKPTDIWPERFDGSGNRRKGGVS